MLENWFFFKLDYLSVWFGASFLLLATIAHLLHLNQRDVDKTYLPWKLFGFFSAFYGIHIWLKVAQLAYRDISGINYVCKAFLICSLIFLYEFSRKGSKYQEVKNLFNCNAVAIMLVIGASAIYWNYNYFVFGICVAIGLPAIFQTVILFRHLYVKTGSSALKHISIVLLIFYILRFIVLFKIHSLPELYNRITNSSNDLYSLMVFISMVLAIGLAYLFWGYAKTLLKDQNVIFKGYYLPFICISLFIAGFVLVEWRSYMFDINMRSDLTRMGNSINRTLNPVNFKVLKFSQEDENLPEYTIICRQLTFLLKNSDEPQFDYFYILAPKDGKYCFGPQSSKKSSKLNTPVGSVYNHFDKLLNEIMETEVSKTFGPYKDDYGEFVSAFVPLKFPNSKKPFCIIGIDMRAEDWKTTIEKKRALILFQYMVLIALPFCFFSYVLRRREMGDFSLATTFPWAAFIVLAGIILTAFVANFVYSIITENSRRNFYALADEKARNICNTFNIIKYDLYGVRLYLTHNGAFKNFNEFMHFSKNVASPVASKMWKWVSVVEENKISEYEKTVQNEPGFENFKVMPFNGQKTKLPFSDKNYNFPVLYAYPESEHKLSSGMDFSFDKVRSEAINRCLKTDLPSVIFPSDFAARYGKKCMFVIVPIDTDGDKKANNVLIQIIPLQEIVDGAVYSQNYDGEYVDFDILDLEQESNRQIIARYQNINNGEKYLNDDFKLIAPVFVFGRSLAILLRPNARFFNEQNINARTIAFAVTGLIITGLLALFINFLQKRHKDLEKLVDERADKIFKQEMLIKTISDNMPIVSFRCTANDYWKFSFLSSEITNLLAASRIDFLSDTIKYSDFVYENDLPVLKKVINEAIEKHQGYDMEYRVVTSDNKIKWVNERGFVVYDSEGKALWIDGSISDVTTRREATAKLNESLYELEKANAELKLQKKRADQFAEEARYANDAKGRFLASMSHEIRTPMNAIIGMCNLVKETSLDATQKNYIDIICSSSGNLLELINDILDFSKMGAGKMQLEKIGFKLTKCVNDCIKMISVRASEKNLVLDCIYDDEVPLYLIGDPTRLTQVILNLVGNAIKFTETGSVSVKISVKERYGDDVVLLFVVSDTGIGIEKKDISSLFNAFAQADNSISRKFGGTGLGLAISKQIVELFKGKIGVESIPGKGSDFWFTARFTVQEHIEIIGADTSDDKLAVNAIMSSETKLSKKILLVEDNEINQQVALAILNKLGFRADVASDGLEAVRILETKPYDLVLMDCQMPGMNGYEATNYIRHGRAGLLNTHVVIIAMTANVLAGDKKKCLDAGMNDYIGKPVHSNQLLEKLEKWLASDNDIQKNEETDTDDIVDKSEEISDSRINDIVSQVEEKVNESTKIVENTDKSESESEVAACLRNIDPSIIDTVELTKRMMGDDKMIRKILDTFDNVAPGIIETLRFAVEAENYDLAREQAHSLKGAAANISANNLRELAEELEGYYKTNDYGRAPECFSRLERAYDNLIKDII